MSGWVERQRTLCYRYVYSGTSTEIWGWIVATLNIYVLLAAWVAAVLWTSVASFHVVLDANTQHTYLAVIISAVINWPGLASLVTATSV
jgi:ABC-type multidrug transport system permease subunit